ncbi:hypothetical protein BGZ72_011118 [Mortierella alpina]|nr:hypothetical protein BGZ72_011118 [Mortierella alpina]
MLGQRHIQQPSECWFDPEARDAKFNIMSPTGRIRPFKGIALPKNKIATIPWERSSNRDTVSNLHSRDAEEQVLGMGQALYGIHAPTDMDGISFVYTKGPAGQTPFPTLVAMSGYFSHQQQQQPLQTPSVTTPNNLPDSTACPLVSQPHPTSEFKQKSCPKSHSTAAPNDNCAPSRKHGNSRPRSDSRALTLDQAQRWRRQPVHQR